MTRNEENNSETEEEAQWGAQREMQGGEKPGKVRVKRSELGGRETLIEEDKMEKNGRFETPKRGEDDFGEKTAKKESSDEKVSPCIFCKGACMSD